MVSYHTVLKRADRPAFCRAQRCKASRSRAVPVDRILAPDAIGAAMLVADSYGVDRTPVIAKLDRPALVIASSASPALAELKTMAERFNSLLREFLKGLE
jgi:hypothetical protein